VELNEEVAMRTTAVRDRSGPPMGICLVIMAALLGLILTVSGASAYPCADSNSAYARFDGQSSESPTITVTGRKFVVMFLSHCGCCETYGLSVEGPGGSYFFKDDGTYDLEPGRYRLKVTGKITTAYGVCSGGELVALVCYNFHG
jgi:hypothetical protein